MLGGPRSPYSTLPTGRFGRHAGECLSLGKGSRLNDFVIATASGRRSLRLYLLLGAAGTMLFATPALADCSASGSDVSCSGTAGPYTNTASGVTLDAASGSTITGPITLGDSAIVSNEGTWTGTAGAPALRVGSNSNVTNAGALTSTATSAGTTTVTLGDYSTLTNNASLSAVSGEPVAVFGKGGTFVNTTSATAAVAGNIQFGLDLGGDVARFSNANTAYGYLGSVTASGNLSVYNSGLFGGSITQTATLGSVNIVNDTGATFSGGINTGDVTTLVNNGSMALSQYSALGTLQAAGTSATNNGSLSLSNTSLAVNGNFIQSASGTLAVTIANSASGTPVAGSTYSQIFATGTASLAGSLVLHPASGFYPTGSVYDVVVGAGGVSGGFSSITGNNLTFISFEPVGIVTLADGSQAFELQVARTTTYAQAIAATATPDEIAVATGFQPLVATASANPTGGEAALVGQIDVLGISDAETFFNDASPAGYRAYANAMRDQTNMFHRQIALRLIDHNGEDDQTGAWLEGYEQFDLGSQSGLRTRESSTAVNGGFDWNGPHFMVGGALGYSYDPLRYAPGNLKGHHSALQTGLYGSVRAGPLVASAIASYQFGSLGTSKLITVGTTTTTDSTTNATTTTPVTTLTATGSAHDHLFSVTGTLGADLKLGGLLLTPFAGIQYSKGTIPSFTEAGAGDADLTVLPISADRTDLLFGANITSAKGHFRPYAKVAYRSEMGSGGGTDVSAYFDGDTATSFTVTGLAAARHEVDADAGVNIVFEDEGTIFAGVEGTVRNDLRTEGVHLGLRLQF
jgi:uncharacterized protein with beta-barrel porin domain